MAPGGRLIASPAAEALAMPTPAADGYLGRFKPSLTLAGMKDNENLRDTRILMCGPVLCACGYLSLSFNSSSLSFITHSAYRHDRQPVLYIETN